MPEKKPAAPQPLVCGLLAHVDAGKTTLSEAMLCSAGALKAPGRVDHGDAFLDTDALERERGITIFSKQALLSLDDLAVTLVDTPGHVDFSTEAERILPILDCAVLVISGTDGVQAHTLTLWKLLERYGVPVFLFVNKMDLPGADKAALMAQLRSRLSSACVDFTAPEEEIFENAALCDEALLESYLSSGTVTAGNLRGLIAGRRLFPCCFGSALRQQGVDELMALLRAYAPRPEYPPEFSARVFKITRDPQGNRLTWLKLTGGTLQVRQALRYTDAGGHPREEKVLALRLYSGSRFTAPTEIHPGCVCAVTGLSATYAGQGLGSAPSSPPPVLEPVMTYRVRSDDDPSLLLPKLRQLEEEDPLLRVLWEPQTRQIHVQIMGQVQLEILRRVAAQRFDTEIFLEDPRIYYKETITAPVEGVGHYEPLRHYAEVHLLLEPAPRGSGLSFASACSTDVLDANYQNLVLTHLAEKQHRGVLTGAPITDMKITLLVGKAHQKHTEGGDFRQATYRAVRQGLMQAQSLLLEPWYDFMLTVPSGQIGRAITDIRSMGGRFDDPVTQGTFAQLTGVVPAAELRDYPAQVASYTQGQGRLQITFHGYDACHDAQAVIDRAQYNPEADLDNSPDSVFCAHGAGFPVKWDKVPEYMHLDSGLKQEKPPELITRNLALDDKELEAIMTREFGPIRRPLYRPPENRPATDTVSIRPPQKQYLIVDGYNMIFAWENLAETAKHDLDAARRQLMDDLSSYAAYRQIQTVLVFDGYRVLGNPGEKEDFHNIQVVYTKEGQTGDQYIEALVARIGSSCAVRVATSDALIQLSSLRSGVLRVSARELEQEVLRAKEQMRAHF